MPNDARTKYINSGHKLRNKAAREAKKFQNRPLASMRWSHRFNPPKGNIRPAVIRLLPGDYVAFDGDRVPYFEYRDHFNANKQRGHICSKRWKEVDGNLLGEGKCVSCYRMDTGAKDTSIRTMKAFSIIHLDWYFKVPKVDKSGKVVKAERDSKNYREGEVIMNFVQKDDALTILGSEKLKKCDKRFGELLHWSLGPSQYSTLTNALIEADKICVCGGNIRNPAYACPDCGFIAIDQEENEISASELYEMITSYFTCPECKAVVELEPMKECDSCNEPESVSIWDVDFEVYKVGEKTKTELHIGKLFYRELDDRVKPLIKEYKDNLHRIFAPDSIEDQLRSLDVKNPWTKEETIDDYVTGYDKDSSSQMGRHKSNSKPIDETEEDKEIDDSDDCF